ncbi:hypothetical protein MBLNU457_3579t1 [Dothideomycetes sp. NU457]
MKEREKEDVEALDAAVDRMRKVLTPGPYIETIDQDKDQQYRYHDRPSSEAWLKNTPFSRQEHYTVQYQTWNYKEWGTDLIQLRVHSQYEDKPKESAKVKEEAKSAVGTPQVGPKKKISLSAYKDKKANGGFDTPTTEQKQPSRDGAQSDRSRGHVRDAIHREDMSKPSQPEKAGQDGTLKRKREEQKPRDPTKHNDQADTPTKRPRAATPERKTMPTSSRDTQPTSDKKRRRDDEEDGEIPARLSPLRAPDLPARLSPIAQLPTRLSPEPPDRIQLPNRLSPSLPDNVLTELDKRAKSRTAAAADDKSLKHDSVRSNSRNNEVKDNGRSDSSERVVSAPKKIKRESDESRTDDAEVRKVVEKVNNVKQESTTSSRKEDSDELKPERLMIRFKIPKRLRQDYRRLLQFPARPAKAVKQELSGDDVRNTEAIKQAEARVKSEKRQSTPVEPAINHSPETTRTVFATPSSRRDKDKDTRSHPAKLDDRTSTSSPALPDATPQSNSSGAPRPSPATSTTRTALSGSWQTEKSRLVALGKSLKKSAQQLSSSSSTAETSALTNIESLLAFILAFHAHDMSYATRQPPVAVSGLDPRATWCTLHGFWKFVHSVTAPWPALQGLVAGLGEAYCAHVLAWCALHPGANNGNGKSDETAEIIGTLSRIAAQKSLSLRSMRELFPETWKRGLEGASADDDGSDARPGNYDGPFDLPVGMQSGTLHAVRAAVCMLREWKCRNGKKFEMTLKLKR